MDQKKKKGKEFYNELIDTWKKMIRFISNQENANENKKTFSNNKLVNNFNNS